MKKRNHVFYIINNLLICGIAFGFTYAAQVFVKVESNNTTNKITTMYNCGKAFDSSAENTHVAWVNSNVDYDWRDNSFIVFYDAQPRHSLTGNVVYMRKREANGSFSRAIKVADQLKSNISCKTQSSGICENGDYISIVARVKDGKTVLGTWVYRSTDKGETWDDGTEIIINNSPVIAYSGDVTGFKKLKNGRLILWGWDLKKKSFSMYSDDNGYTWSYGKVGDGEVYNATEPAFCELSDGTIIGLFRDDVSKVPRNEKKAALFAKSTDGGITWSTPVKSKTITDMSNNNGTFIYDENSKEIEFIYGSRHLESDGSVSIYQCVFSENDAKLDNFGKQNRIGNRNSWPNMIIRDFGYIGGAVSKDGIVMIFYYSGTTTSSNIYYMMGYKNKVGIF